MAEVKHLGLFPNRFLDCPSTNLNQSAILNGLYPDIWMPQNYAIAMYWRVKKWKFSYSNAWSEIGETFWQYSNEIEFTIGQLKHLIQSQAYEEGESGPVYTLEDLVSGFAPNNETGLVCGPEESEYEQLIEQDFGPPILVTNTFDQIFDGLIFVQSLRSISGVGSPAAGTRTNANIFWSWNGAPASIKIINGEKFMRPHIMFSASTFRWTNIRASSWISNTQPPLGTYGTFSYKLLDEVFSTDIYAYNSRSTTSGFLDILDVNASFEAVEYWPYDPEDGGGPIYDSATGAVLRPDYIGLD